MLIGEIVVRKNNIKRKINELKNYIDRISDSTVESPVKGALYTKSIGDLFELYSKLQNHTALLDSENAKNKIQIKKDLEMSVLDAVHVRKTTGSKIEIYDRLISNGDVEISIKDLMYNREALLEEYILLDSKIKESDWTTTLG